MVVPKYRFTPPSQSATVRSYWRPAGTEKSASSTTLLQPLWHPLGGAKAKRCGWATIDDASPRSSNASRANTVTVQGLLAGRDTGGSAEASTREPSCKPVAASACKPSIEATHATSKAANPGSQRHILPTFTVTISLYCQRGSPPRAVHPPAAVPPPRRSRASLHRAPAGQRFADS